MKKKMNVLKRIGILFIPIFIFFSLLIFNNPRTLISNAISFFSGNDPYAYVSQAKLTKVIDGTAPFDNLIADQETYDSSGNVLTYSYGDDSNNSNGIVRSFDTITYNVENYFQPIDESKSYTEANIYFEGTLNLDMTEARFDLDQMKWLDSYTITYYDKNGNVLATGTDSLPDYSANEHANDSTHGVDSYKTEVVKQVIVGKYTLKGETADSIVIPGTKTFSIGIKVYAARNGTIVQPTFKFWVENNENNNNVNSSINTSKTIVSAVARYNAVIKRNSDLSYLGDFNFESGQVVDEETDSSIHGRMLGYSVAIQLYNEYHGDESGASVSTKGRRGIEYPAGDITFDLTFAESGYILDDGNNFKNESYTPLLWDYSLNNGSKIGKLGRNKLFYNSPNILAGRGTAPIAADYTGKDYPSDSANTYNGGIVTHTSSVDYKEIMNSNATSKYSFLISKYDFDLDNFYFPVKNYQKVKIIDNYTTYIGVFATTYFQVLLQFPNDYNADQSIYIGAKVDNLNINTVSGNAASDYTDNELTNENIFKSEVEYGDNLNNATIALFVPGSFNKRNSITKIGSTYVPTNFLGSSSYWLQSHDASALIGQEVLLMSDGYISEDSDYNIKSINNLLKFDSEVFELLGQNATYFSSTYHTDTDYTATYLYAADPLYPNGWSSNDEEEMARMNNAVEEDLIYFSSLDELENAGYTCIGVLAEVRNINNHGIEDWVNLAVKVKIKDDASLIGKTYASTNAIRVWVNDGDMNNISWRNANNNLTSVDTSLTEFNNSLNSYIKPQFKKEKTTYIKSEFEDGVLVNGTHSGGYHYGMSVLILGYNARVMISSNANAYDMDKGERLATFNVTPSVDLSDASSSGLTTDLKIKIDVDENLTLLSNTISSSGTKISNDKNEPTLLYDAEGYSYNAYFEVTSEGTYVYLTDVRVANHSLPVISFDAIIGHAGQENDVNNNDTVSVTTSISGSGDSRAYSEIAGNMSKKTVSIIKLSSTSLGKFTTNEIIEKNGEITYNIVYSNNSDADMSNFNLYDVLPFTNDNRSNSFSGTYEISDITLTFKNDSTNKAIIYYSNDENTRVFTSQEADNVINSFNIYNGGTINAKTLAVKATGLTAQSSITIVFTIKTKENNSGDIYINNLFVYNPSLVESTMLNSNYVQTQVVERKISGISFEDANGDNLYTESDKLLSNIKANLLDSSKKVISTTITDSKGYYEFKVPDRGVYYVSFEVPTGYEIVSKGTSDNASKVNSDAITDLIDHTYTATLPVEMVDNQNIGLRKKEAKLNVKHLEEGTNDVLAPEENKTVYYSDSYTTSQSNEVSSDYELVAIPSNATGTVDKDLIEVIYYYKLKETTLTVHHYIEGTTTKLADDEISTKKYRDPYTTSPSSKVSNNYEVTGTPSNASGTISGPTEVTYYYKLKEAKLNVKHLEEGTNTVLAPDENETVYYGDSYTTSQSNEVPSNYELLRKTDNFTGIVSTPTIEVIYYYQKKDSNLTTTISKDGPEKITSKEEKISYKVEYVAEVSEYIGDGLITITDTLPYEIDIEKSSLDGGTYSKENKTIIWTEEWNNINTYTGGSKKTITKNIELVYVGINPRDRIMINSVKGYIKLDNNERTTEDQTSTEIKIPGTIIVHYYEKGTTNKLTEDIETSDLVGIEYTTERKVFEGYNLVTIPDTELYTYEEEIQEVIYEYEKIKVNVVTKVIGGHGTITGDEEVDYGNDSTKDYIVIKPDEGYELGSLKINGEEIEITDEMKDGFILDNFIEMKEDALVEVMFISKPVENPNTGSYISIFLCILSIIAFVYLYNRKCFKKLFRI